MARNFGCIYAVELNWTAVRIVKTHQQVNHGRLACASRANDGDFLPWLDIGAKVVNNRAILVIAEFNMVERHLTSHIV